MPKKRPSSRSAISNELPLGDAGIKRNANLFVLGDLLIDHTAFVGDTPNYPFPVTGEQAYRVKHRLDTAGGAATTARTIDALTDGTTFLWGLIGRSPWGTFRSILENSQALDGTKSRIEFRAVRDETDASMSTISRLVTSDTDAGREHYRRKARFVDFGQLHVSVDRQLSAIRHHLDRVHGKAPLAAIILNDLDMGALHRDVVTGIAKFGEEQQIPVVVRARRTASKYTELRAAALVCTLAEWKELVSSDRDPDYWSANIGKIEVAEEFARQTLSVFHQTDRFVILVGDDWIDRIIILEHEVLGQAGRLLINNGLPKSEKGKSQQVGASDVFAGALALAMVGSDEGRLRFDNAVRFARSVAGAYQQSGWHRVPSRGLIQVGGPEDLDDGKAITERRFGTPYLPSEKIIDISRAQTCFPRILSVTQSFKTLLEALANEVTKGDRSIVLVAAGGSGKTEISKYLIEKARERGYEACEFHDRCAKWSWSAPQKTIAAIKKACGSRSDGSFVVVDEALKLTGASNIATKGVVLLDLAKKERIRFLFVDADFAKISADKLKSQFARRVSWHKLPSPWEHPRDVPYVFCALLRACAPNRNVAISVEASALVAVIEWLIEERQNFGELSTLAEKLVGVQKDSHRICVRWTDLPRHIQGAYRPYRSATIEEYVPKFD